MESASTVGVALAVALGGVLLLWWRQLSSGWRGASKSGARLPKGSFGWPVIGESIDFMRDPVTFASSHAKRYGRIFKSSLFLKPTILGTTPEFAKFVLGNKDNIFVTGHPTSTSDVLGSKSLMFQDGPQHKSLKKIIMKSLVPESLRTKVGTLEAIILDHMATWERKGIITGRVGAQKITMDTSILLLLGERDIGNTPEGREMLENLVHLDEALFSIPLNLPGTTYNKGIKAKEAMGCYLKQLTEKRKGQQIFQGDVLGEMLAALMDPQARDELEDFSDETMCDNLVFVWFAAYETTSTTLTWILKLLNDHPDIFSRIQAEQQEILRSRDSSAEGPGLSWDDTKKMVYSLKFYQEVLRYISSAPALMRKATRDVEFDGHLIPKDWAVFCGGSSIHFDPENFFDPDRFDPNRFDAQPKPYTYLPFAAGAHICAGMEFAKLISLIFIHHVTINYTHESAGPDLGAEFNALKIPKGGYPITFRRRLN